MDCNYSKNRKKTTNTSKYNNPNDARFNDEKVADHDKAIALWLLKQASSMRILSIDNKGNTRIQAFTNYSEHNGRDREILDYQKSAIHEFIGSYSGTDKNEILQIWLNDQIEAKNALKSFIDSVDSNVKSSEIENYDGKNKYDNVILIQEYYMDQIDSYRKEWNNWHSTFKKRKP